MDTEASATDGGSGSPPSIAKYVVFAAVLYAVIQVYSILAPILLSFLLIILITLAINPIISFIRNWAGGRKRAAGLAFLGALLVGAFAVWGTVTPLKRTITTLTEALPEYWERLQKPLIKMEQQAVLTEKKLQDEVSAEIASESAGSLTAPSGLQHLESVWSKPPPETDAPSPPREPREKDGSLRSNLVGFIQGVFGEARGVLNSTTEMLIVFVTVFFGVIFSLMNPRPIFAAFFSVIPQRHHGRTQIIMVRIAEFVPRWAGSVLISMLFIGLVFFGFMWPIFGLADALMLGLIAGVLSAIPFLGPLLTLIPALMLAIGAGGMTPLWVILAYVVVQGLESYVIMPMVMSGVMKVHPVALIFAIILSIACFGALGVLIAVPLVIIIGIVHKELYRNHYMPTVSDEDLDRLAGGVLLEKEAGAS